MTTNTSCKTLYNVLSHTRITIWALRRFMFFGGGMVYFGGGGGVSCWIGKVHVGE